MAVSVNYHCVLLHEIQTLDKKCAENKYDNMIRGNLDSITKRS
jgi:hypothetical protein